jgi:Ser-tRNA(Ala) deacylase AlaX
MIICLYRFSVGEEVAVEIDGVKRLLHARIHSAGHLLDTACRNIGLTGLEPSKVM